MRVPGAYEKARQYIESHSDMSQLKTGGPFITISRQTGIGAETICERLLDFLRKRAKEGYIPWTFFDKNLINRVIEEHGLPEHLDKYLSEEYFAKADSMFSELLGLHPSKMELMNKTAKTIMKLARMGNVIIVGRGANIITGEFKNAFHIRLVAPADDRLKQAEKLYGYDVKKEKEFIKKEDASRKSFIKKYFHKDIDDPLLYHMVINTRLLDFGEVAETIGSALIKKYPDYFNPCGE